MKRKESFQLLVLILLTIAIYYPATKAGFIIDDDKFFTEDSLTAVPNGLFQIWFSPTDNNHVWPYLPITRSTFWLERQIWGLNPQVTHWVNILFHLFSAIFLWRVLKRCQYHGAWWVGIFFAVHPVHVQSVAWIAERKNVVAAVFYILCMWSYVEYEKKHRWLWYGLALILFSCALLSKTSVIMLPVILIFLRVWLKLDFKKADYLKLLPFFLLSLGAGYARIWFEINAFGTIVDSRTFLEKILIATHVPFFYFTKLIFPYPLIFTYPKWNIIPDAFFLYLPLVSIGLLMIISIQKYHSWGRPLVLGLGVFGVGLFPVLGFFANAWTQFSYVSDHWLHLPSIPVLILGVQGVRGALGKISLKNSTLSQYVPGIAGIVLIAIFSILTWNQTLSYRNSEALWLATLSKNQNSWIAHQELGRLYREVKQYELALQHSNKSLELKSDLFRAYNNRANVYTDIKQYRKAISDYDQALKIYPGFVDAYYNRGNAYYHLKEHAKSLQDYNRALTINPNYAKAYYNRGRLHFELKQYPQALEDFSHVLKINPNEIDAYYNRANTFFLLEQHEQALEDFSRVIELDPSFTKAYHNRGLIYLLKKQNPQLGCADLKHACQLGECKYYRIAQQQRIC